MPQPEEVIKVNPKDPTTWYRQEDAGMDVGLGMTVRDLAERIFNARKNQQPPRLRSRVCERYGCDWKSVTWAQMLPEIQKNIFEFCFWLRFKPTKQQAKVLKLAQSGVKRIAVKSGQGPGKTTCSTIIGLWWQLQDIDVRCIITAPSMKQCRDVWLSEARERMQKAHPLLRKFIRVTSSRVYFGGFKSGGPLRKNWRCELVTASTDTSFQGQHNKRLNAIVEEASGMETTIIEALKGTVSNVENEFQEGAEEGSILMIGNPNARDSEFFKCFGRMGSYWSTLTLNAEESPIVNPAKLIQHAIEFGVDSDFYHVRVLGNFPSTDPRGIVNAEDVYACTKTSVRVALEYEPFKGQKQFGIDLARQGGDETVVYRRSGGCIVEWQRWAKSADFEPAHAIRWAFMAQRKAEWRNHETEYIFDAGGIGQGTVHLFDEAGKEYFLFHTQSTPQRANIFKNRMSEAWFQFAAAVRSRKVRIPDDPILHAQLTSRHYTMDKDGLIVIEPKDKYMLRTKEKSPDRADALVMAFYQNGRDETQLAGRD